MAMSRVRRRSIGWQISGRVHRNVSIDCLVDASTQGFEILNATQKLMIEIVLRIINFKIKIKGNIRCVRSVVIKVIIIWYQQSKKFARTLNKSNQTTWWQHICYSRFMTTLNHQDLWNVWPLVFLIPLMLALFIFIRETKLTMNHIQIDKKD